MSKTAFVWLIAFTSGAIFAFVNPIYGLYAYFLDYYAHPPLRWWGADLPDLRWSLLIAFITLAAFVLRRMDLPKIENQKHPQSKWLVLFVLTAFAVTQLFAVWKEKSDEQLLELVKFTVLYFLIIAVVRTKQDLRYLFLVHVLGVAYWGWNAFSDPKRSEGRLVNVGGPDSLNDNAAASLMLAILPLMAVVFLTGKRWEKGICLLAAPLVLNAFILCNSRGAFVALLVTVLAALVLTTGILRLKVFLGVILAGVVFVSLVDPQFAARQSTIVKYEEDSSASNRLELWKGALRLIKDNPFGSGGGGFVILSPQYASEVVEATGNPRAAHNTYLLAATDWGVAGVTFYLTFLVVTFFEFHRLRRVPAETPAEKTLHLQSLGLELGLIGILTAGMFTSRLYAEAIYWFAALAAVLRNLHSHERKEAADRQHELPA